MSMRLAVIGASRGIGLQLTTQALAAGHSVSGLARNPERCGLRDPRLELVAGDIRNEAVLARVCSGCDAVCVCISVAPSRAPVDTFSAGAGALLPVLERDGPSRLLVVTGIGAGESRGHGGWFYDRILQPLLLGQMYADKDREEALVRRSELDWLLVRPGRLTNGRCRGQYRVTNSVQGLRGGSISRADVAHYMLGELERPRYHREAVHLIY
ncbi:MAG: SDR family oxidoreductase [Chromatiales bacterium]|jgi:putative NADH-flavin reductase|nr:SDR family oxidoreductase [Chromatiales bacterium]MDH3894831.1 SDR family oxidoreductase [Chromatiales bacterium]MDH3933305.1 SDR family oxidoreductase [Chromatiales bacterium]MDH4013141.1 SDR family oxidoreductase [Chromatiales bacterium]PLX54758.1 MAG: flavin reductase [Chromatiales bacterium]